MKTRHGIKIIEGPLFMFDEPEVVAAESRVQRRMPAPILIRGYKIAKHYHYPSELLFKLQKGRCFFCGDTLDSFVYKPGEGGGYAKAHFYPKNKRYPLWGNKVLAHSACAMKYKNVPPAPELVSRFDHLYSPEAFAAEFGEEDSMLLKGAM